MNEDLVIKKIVTDTSTVKLLDKIREEIKQEPINVSGYIMKYRVLGVIDRYRRKTGMKLIIDIIQNRSIGVKQIINSVKNGIPAYKAIPSVDLDLKQSFKDGYDTALNDLEDRFEALLNNNPWYANAISDILQIINEQKGSD